MGITNSESEGGSQSERNLLDDSENFINVDMNSYGVTTVDRGHTILKTTGLGPCVGVALYEPAKKVAGLFHLTTPLDATVRGTPLWKSVQEDIVALLSAMQRNGVTFDDRANIEASLIGGEYTEELPRLIPVIEERLRQLGISKIVISEEGEKGKVKDFAIDAKNGRIYSLQNILPRKKDDDVFAFQIRGNQPHVTSDNRSLS